MNRNIITWNLVQTCVSSGLLKYKQKPSSNLYKIWFTKVQTET